MSSQSQGLWFGCTRSVKSWKSSWAPTRQTCHSISSASWMTSMSLEKWTGKTTHPFLVTINSHFSRYKSNRFYICGIRGQFEDMCADLLARVEPPLQSLLENTSKCTSGFSLSWVAYHLGSKQFLCSIRTEKRRHICSGDSGWCFQNPCCQRENWQILWEGVEHHTECWWSCGPWMRSAGISQVLKTSSQRAVGSVRFKMFIILIFKNFWT